MEKIIIILIFVVLFSLIIGSLYTSTIKSVKNFTVYNDITPLDYFKNSTLSSSTSSPLITMAENKEGTCNESEKIYIYPDMPCLGFTEDAMMPAMSCGVVLNNIDVSYS